MGLFKNLIARNFHGECAVGALIGQGKKTGHAATQLERVIDSILPFEYTDDNFEGWAKNNLDTDAKK